MKVTAALQFFASSAFQHPLSSIHGISQSAISSCIQVVTSGLVQHAHTFIQFPMTPDSQECKTEFWAKYGFPGVLGAIDCTHVQLHAPSENSLAYINRKGTHSINIQVICDASCKVTHVLANFPESSHDSFIFANSNINRKHTKARCVIERTFAYNPAVRRLEHSLWHVVCCITLLCVMDVSSK